jgi:hypothetical protein
VGELSSAWQQAKEEEGNQLIDPGVVVLPSSLNLLCFVALLNQEWLPSLLLSIHFVFGRTVFTLLAFLTLSILFSNCLMTGRHRLRLVFLALACLVITLPDASVLPIYATLHLCLKLEGGDYLSCRLHLILMHFSKAANGYCLTCNPFLVDRALSSSTSGQE